MFYNAEDSNHNILIAITQKIDQMNDFPVIGMIGTYGCQYNLESIVIVLFLEFISYLLSLKIENPYSILDI